MGAVKVFALFCACGLVYWAGLVLPVLPFGTNVFSAVATFFPLVSLVAIMSFGAELVTSIEARAIRRAIQAFSMCLAIIAGTVAGIWIGQLHRMQRIGDVAAAAMPLVRAIEAFERTERRAPSALSELVPGYLMEIPPTRMGGYQDWRYIAGPGARQYGDNEWVLIVQTGGLGFNFDQLMYFPNQRYPAFGHGGSIQRVGAWAYVHE